MGTSLVIAPDAQDGLDLEAFGFNLDLLERIHGRYQDAGYDGPSEVVDWMEMQLRKGEDPIPRLQDMMAGVCDVVLALGGSEEYATTKPTILVWLDREAKSCVLEVRC